MSKISMIDQDALIKHLEGRIKKEAQGNQKEWARANGISSSYVSDVLSGRADAGKKILDVLGFERVTMFKKTK